jgi:hypothetical protein
MRSIGGSGLLGWRRGIAGETETSCHGSRFQPHGSPGRTRYNCSPAAAASAAASACPVASMPSRRPALPMRPAALSPCCPPPQIPCAQRHACACCRLASPCGVPRTCVSWPATAMLRRAPPQSGAGALASPSRPSPPLRVRQANAGASAAPQLCGPLAHASRGPPFAVARLHLPGPGGPHWMLIRIPSRRPCRPCNL